MMQNSLPFRGVIGMFLFITLTFSNSLLFAQADFNWDEDDIDPLTNMEKTCSPSSYDDDGDDSYDDDDSNGDVELPTDRLIVVDGRSQVKNLLEFRLIGTQIGLHAVLWNIKKYKSVRYVFGFDFAAIPDKLHFTKYLGAIDSLSDKSKFMGIYAGSEIEFGKGVNKVIWNVGSLFSLISISQDVIFSPNGSSYELEWYRGFMYIFSTSLGYEWRIRGHMALEFGVTAQGSILLSEDYFWLYIFPTITFHYGK